jgi:hypothetical protein
MDDAWPDVLLFLDAGVVVAKNYQSAEDGFGGEGYVRLLRAGEDSLMIFAASLMTLISERSVQVEDPSFLEMHIDLDAWSGEYRTFRLGRPVAGRIPPWSKARSV